MDTQTEMAQVDVFVQKRFRTAGARDELLQGPDSARLERCFDLHGIRRIRSFLARDGQRVLCHFRAVDAESLRIALRVAEIDYDALWTGAVSQLPGAVEPALVVERIFESPQSAAQVRACRSSAARHLLDLNVEPACVLISRCRKRLLWLCRAATPATIRAAELKLANLGFEAWGCQP